MTERYAASTGTRPDRLAIASNGPLHVKKLMRMVRAAERRVVGVGHRAPGPTRTPAVTPQAQAPASVPAVTTQPMPTAPAAPTPTRPSGQAPGLERPDWPMLRRIVAGKPV
jgi:hypothetical protein